MAQGWLGGQGLLLLLACVFEPSNEQGAGPGPVRSLLARVATGSNPRWKRLSASLSEGFSQTSGHPVRVSDAERRLRLPSQQPHGGTMSRDQEHIPQWKPKKKRYEPVQEWKTPTQTSDSKSATASRAELISTPVRAMDRFNRRRLHSKDTRPDTGQNCTVRPGTSDDACPRHANPPSLTSSRVCHTSHGSFTISQSTAPRPTPSTITERWGLETEAADILISETSKQYTCLDSIAVNSVRLEQSVLHDWNSQSFKPKK